jgi:DNA polymerase V
MATPIDLEDCNNFYASCERLFQPELRGRPVVVLSNNDGCVIARSNEAKALGIAMGAPWHLNKPLFAKHGVVVRSSNYTLYGDLSARVMTVLRTVAPELEVTGLMTAWRATPCSCGQRCCNGQAFRCRWALPPPRPWPRPPTDWLNSSRWGCM